MNNDDKNDTDKKNINYNNNKWIKLEEELIIK
jgi:hypothetical protein